MGFGKPKLYTTYEVVIVFYYGNMVNFSLKIEITQYGEPYILYR